MSRHDDMRCEPTISGQDRAGNPKRRKLEFAIVMDQLARRRAAFSARLKRNLEPAGDCLLYRGTLDRRGYPRIAFRYMGKIYSLRAHTVFLILKIKKPIPVGFDVGHEPICTNNACIKHIRAEHYIANCSTQHREAA